MRPFVGPVIAPPQWQYRRYQQWHRDKIATPAGPANTQRPTHSLNWCAYALMWMGGCHAHRHTHTRTLVSVNALQLIRETLIRGTRLIRQADNVVRARQESERASDSLTSNRCSGCNPIVSEKQSIDQVMFRHRSDLSCLATSDWAMRWKGRIVCVAHRFSECNCKIEQWLLYYVLHIQY